MGRRRFADAALGKGGLQFIRPYRGRSIRLATADKVLRFMGEPRFGPLFRREVEGFLAVTGMKAYLLGEMAVGDPGLLTTRQTAAQVGLSPRTLERFRVTGQGPRFHKLGRRVRYARKDIEDWLKGCVRRSTSDDGGDSGGCGQTA